MQHFPLPRQFAGCSIRPSRPAGEALDPIEDPSSHIVRRTGGGGRVADVLPHPLAQVAAPVQLLKARAPFPLDDRTPGAMDHVGNHDRHARHHDRAIQSAVGERSAVG